MCWCVLCVHNLFIFIIYTVLHTDHLQSYNTVHPNMKFFGLLAFVQAALGANPAGMLSIQPNQFVDDIYPRITSFKWTGAGSQIMKLWKSSRPYTDYLLKGVAVGSVDPYWTTSFAGSKPVSAQAGSSEYWKIFSGYANWITAPPPANGQPYAAGEYTFSTSFDIIKQNPEKYVLTATVAADDQVRNVTVNGHAIVMGQPCADSKYKKLKI